MSVSKPSITKVTLGAITNNALMIALFSHFNGNSIYFTPVLNGGNPIEKGFSSGEDSFLIEPVDSNESWQINFRRTTNDRGLVMVDPGNGITDSGTTVTTPVGATSQASAEVDYPWNMNATFSSANVMILEWFDALMILISDNGDSFVSFSCHIGRIHSPFNSTNAADGFDGLGVFCGKPFLSETSVADSWATATTTTQQIRIGTNTWVDNVTALLSTTGYDAFVGTRPDGIVLRYLGRPIGVLKYIVNFTGSSELSFERIQDGSNVVQYMYFFDKASTTTQIVPWVDGVTAPT